MRLGLLADIHEAIPQLEEALALFRGLALDEIVVLGDICRMHRHLTETLTLLRDAKAVGVWGNHDFGLCFPWGSRDFSDRFPANLLAYARTYKGRLIRDDCHFSHVQAWLDPEVVEDLWYMEQPPCSSEGVAKSFAAVPQRVLFSGHVHRWCLATPEGPVAWDGTSPVVLERNQRWFVTIHALCRGFAATYDTATCELVPLALTPREEDT